ncbi:MAG: glycosyltransferase family 2 protein [Prevotellaceae bacterium]|jgi:glycosyltransferase involved in cell wall biosynthesis|nr:glycosyltransferase family 2 protein [Prevotellaceae bacterium]
MEISAVIITYNEEKNIARCLQSLQGVADEIIVVDSGSTDRTEEICREFGVTSFIYHPFEGHIQQKNWAMEQAAHSHILSLDADEALSNELKKSILEVKESWTADAYEFNRLTCYCGKWIRHCGWYPDAKVRLWDRRKGRWGGVNPHDKIVMENSESVTRIKGDLLHYSYYSISEHILQLNKFTEVGAREYLKKGKKVSVMKIIYKPVWKFIRDYFVKLGVLDGYYGFIICAISAFATFVKYVKAKQLLNFK